MEQVVIDIPLGIPLEQQKKQVEINQELKDHIAFVEQKFDEISGQVKRRKKEIKNINLLNYKIDKNIFGFNVGEFELRDNFNLFNSDVYQNCIISSIVKLNENKIDKKDLENTQIMRRIKQITYRFGKQPKMYEFIIVLIILATFCYDSYQMSIIFAGEWSLSAIVIVLPLRIFFLFLLFTCQFAYFYYASRNFFILTYTLSILTTVVDVLCLYGFDLMNEEIFMLVGQLIQSAIIIIGCFLLCMYFYILEMNLQKIRVLLGGQYQPPFWCLHS